MTIGVILIYSGMHLYLLQKMSVFELLWPATQKQTFTYAGANLQSTVDIIPMVTNLSESLTQPFNHCMEYPLLFQTILYHPSLNQCVLLLALSERKVIPNADKLLARPYCVLKFICLILSGGTRAQCQHHHVNNLFD